MGDLEGSERAFREALRLRRLALPPDHPSLALTMNNLGTVLTNLGRLDEAEAVHQEAMDIFVRVLGPDHHRVGLSAYNLARVHRLSGRLAEAESLLAETLRIDRATYGESHLEVGLDLRQLGEIQREAGDCGKAAVTLTEADAIFETNSVPLSERRRLLVRSNLGACLLALGRTGEAEAVLLPTIRAAEADSSADPAAHRMLLEQVESLFRAAGSHEEAEATRQGP